MTFRPPDATTKQVGKTRLEAGAVIASAGCTVLMQMPLVDADGQQRHCDS